MIACVLLYMDTTPTEIYTEEGVGSVRGVYETGRGLVSGAGAAQPGQGARTKLPLTEPALPRTSVTMAV